MGLCLQNRAVRFIARFRERESVMEAWSELGLQPLKQKHKNHKLSDLLMKILQDEITGDRQKVTMTTRSAAREEITSHVYHDSFLPRTIRDTRGNTDKQTKHRNSLKTE